MSLCELEASDLRFGWLIDEQLWRKKHGRDAVSHVKTAIDAGITLILPTVTDLKTF